MALTELERQKDSISWEPISERADFITTLSYKRGSTIPLCRTLVFTKEYYKAGSNFITTLSYNYSTLFRTKIHFTKEYYEAEADFITTLYWPENGVQLYHTVFCRK